MLEISVVVLKILVVVEISVLHDEHCFSKKCVMKVKTSVLLLMKLMLLLLFVVFTVVAVTVSAACQCLPSSYKSCNLL